MVVLQSSFQTSHLWKATERAQMLSTGNTTFLTFFSFHAEQRLGKKSWKIRVLGIKWMFLALEKNSGHTFHTLQQAGGPWVSAACETKSLEPWATEQMGRQKSSQRSGRIPTEKTSFPAPFTSVDSLWPFKVYLNSISSEEELFQTCGDK